MLEICDKKDCTGCGLCKHLCPKNCITFVLDALGVSYPMIDESKCISCNLCRKVCPSLQYLTAKKPMTAYAAWSTNKNTRNNGASGGIAQEIYQWAIKNNYYAYGVVFSKENGAKYIRFNKIKEIESVRNSKYVFSDLTTCLNLIDNDLKSDKKILFIGLPCQVAAIKKIAIQRKKEKNLITVDLICHGTPPQSYLQEHLSYLEQIKKKKIENLTFRNPNSTYRFSLWDKNGKEFYHKKPDENDVYFKGFMSNLILRENCYHCHYATETRISDITIGDFDGASKLSIPEKQQLSLVLPSTKEGKQLIQNLVQEKKIEAMEQDLELAMSKNKALHCPSSKHPKRTIFEREYYNNEGFENAAKIALKQELLYYKLTYIPNHCKYFILHLVPRNIKDKIKQQVKRK